MFSWITLQKCLRHHQQSVDLLSSPQQLRAWLVFRTCMYASRTNVLVSRVKIYAQRHTIAKQICFPNGNVLFLSLFSLSRNWMHNVACGCAEILPWVVRWEIVICCMEHICNNSMRFSWLMISFPSLIEPRKMNRPPTVINLESH